MNAGDCFYIDLRNVSGQPHLWIVLSDPNQFPEEIVIVSVTTGDDDRACILSPGDHLWVRWRSCVMYARPEVVGINKLSSSAIRWQDPLRAEILTNVLAGAQTTKMLPRKVREILVTQGLISK